MKKLFTLILAVVMTVNGASEGLEKLIIVMVMATLITVPATVPKSSSLKKRRNWL